MARFEVTKNYYNDFGDFYPLSMFINTDFQKVSKKTLKVSERNPTALAGG